MALGPCDPRVRRRAQLPDQAELLDRCLELGAEHPPFDPLDGRERSLDRRPLPVAAEVGAEACAQVACAADVEHRVVAVTEEVDAGPRRRTEGEAALVPDAPRPRRRERDELGDGACAALLCQPDQCEEHLRGRLRVRQRPVARLYGRAEEVRELGEACPRYASGEEAAGERHRVHDGCGDP